MRTFLNKSVNLFCTLGPIGHISVGSGTAGSAFALPLAYFFMQGHLFFHMLACIVVCILGIVASEAYVQKTGRQDPSEVVIDEVAGQLIALVGLPATGTWILAGFFVFRILDIFKPFPISYFDRKVKGGVGIMSDDIVAGMIANLVLQIIYQQPWGIWLSNFARSS